MTNQLSPQTIALVKATVPALVEHGSTITRVMYERLFEDADIRALFNQANQGEGGGQVHALSAAIIAYAQNIDNLSALAPAVERISHKHIGFDILPAHYPFVATALLGAISEVLGEVASDEILAAWGEAYWFLAGVLKAREAAMRDVIVHSEGGWSGWRKFVVAEKIRESALITSFVLRPVDGGKVIPHRPGQYLTFRFDAADAPGLKRNYSISCGPQSDHYRISVKREANGNGGSRHLHDFVDVGDVLETTPPSGDFFLSNDPARPVILLSGGVGLTPMVSMIEAIAKQHPALPTYYVHATASSVTHAMDAHVKSLAARHANIKVATFYSDAQETDVRGQTHDEDGFVSVDWLRANTPLMEAEIYLCGPKPFLRTFVSGLTQEGVAGEHIHYEFFGPADELLAA
ncbi:NO-inducible flavohemoprotein [Sphingomonas sp. RB3P16]|uniref:NO-inducible flavohemoprotein n=1 Tax=Parasphingomonas frigoris TaxID=3096163 RepID=UPI002FC816FA